MPLPKNTGKTIENLGGLLNKKGQFKK